MKALLSFILFFIISNNLFCDDLIEYDYELDFYYTNVSAFIDLDRDNNITDAISYSETEIYSDLFFNTFSPNIFLLEASLHPMGIGGLYFRKDHKDLYDKSSIDDFNLVKALSAGYEEPYALSFFIGRMVVFKGKEDGYIGKNRAFVGTLITIGDYSIKDNSAHYDRWYNIEFKLKGTREKRNSDLDWSFRVGARVHQNSDFTDTLYIGARRSSIDYKKSIWSFIHNSAFSTMIAVSSKSFKLTESEVILEKKWPVAWSEKMSFGLGIGYLYNSGKKYQGELREEGVDNHQLIFRPNLKW